jgi:hypothetical protein
VIRAWPALDGPRRRQQGPTQADPLRSAQGRRRDHDRARPRARDRILVTCRISVPCRGQQRGREVGRRPPACLAAREQRLRLAESLRVITKSHKLDASSAKPVERPAKYLVNNTQLLHCDRALAEGLPIATSAPAGISSRIGWAEPAPDGLQPRVALCRQGRAEPAVTPSAAAEARQVIDLARVEP